MLGEVNQGRVVGRSRSHSRFCHTSYPTLQPSILPSLRERPVRGRRLEEPRSRQDVQHGQARLTLVVIYLFRSIYI